MILLSTAAVAAGYLGTAAAPTLAVACAASVIGGIGNGTQWASVETAIHQVVDEAVPDTRRRRARGPRRDRPGVGIVVGGMLTALFSPRAAYLVAGLGLLVLVAVGRLLGLSVVKEPVRVA